MKIRCYFENCFLRSLKTVVEVIPRFAFVAVDHRRDFPKYFPKRSFAVLLIEIAVGSLAERVAAVGHLAEAKVRFSDAYPAWQPDWNSDLLHKSKAIYHELFNKEPIVEVIHAGLECGIIGEKKPGMQMISFGPTIENAHSPDERLKISDVDKIWRLLVNLVQNV